MDSCHLQSDSREVQQLRSGFELKPPIPFPGTLIALLFLSLSQPRSGFEFESISKDDNRYATRG